MLDKLNGQPVTRAWENRLARIEQRLAKSEENTEQRVLILRDALGKFVADFFNKKLVPLDAEIKTLKIENVELRRQLQEKSNVDKQVAEVARRLDAQQAARDEGKRGKTGRQGERGARGEQGPPGPRGPAGKPATHVSFHKWHYEIEKFRATPFFTDGSSWEPIDLMPFFRSYDDLTR